MSDFPTPLHEAVSERDAGSLIARILEREFVLLSTSRSDEVDDGNIGAITALLDDMEVLVVFSDEREAGNFVQENGDAFESDEDVDGVVVDGDALLDYLPDGYGMMLDPDSETAIVIEPGLLREVKSLKP